MRVFTKSTPNDYGPRASNPTYLVTGANGTLYRVERHHWEWPSRWGWVARPIDPATGARLGTVNGYVFGDDLAEIAHGVGRLDDFERNDS